MYSFIEVYLEDFLNFVSQHYIKFFLFWFMLNPFQISSHIQKPVSAAREQLYTVAALRSCVDFQGSVRRSPI